MITLKITINNCEFEYTGDSIDQAISLLEIAKNSNHQSTNPIMPYIVPQYPRPGTADWPYITY